MKRITSTTSVGLLAALVISLFGAKSASATVGGPSYISEIGYSKQGYIYYIDNNYGGRGCLPIIHTINSGTLQDSEVKSCDQTEKEYSDEGGSQRYSQFVRDTYKDLSYLGSVSLKKNNIAVDVTSVSEKKAEDGSIQWTDFLATIKQDGNVIGTINFTGCTKDQPHTFEGYMIPSSNMMAVLISNKGDCFEGGYVNETLHVIKGIAYRDTTIIRSYKENSATEPNAANLIVYAASDTPTESEPPVVQKDMSDSIVIFASLTGLILGILLGYSLGRRSRPSL